MSETGLAQVDNGIPNLSDISADVLVDRNPEQLMRDGYAERVDFVPRQAQSIISTVTDFEAIVDDQSRMSTTMHSSNEFVVHLPVSLPKTLVPSLHALQEWEGYVLESREGEFSARLLDLTADALANQPGRMPEEEAIIPHSEISDYDLDRLRPGSVFRWVIGYERSVSGTKRRVSQIVFRDLPAMTKQDRTEGSEWARKIAQTIVD